MKSIIALLLGIAIMACSAFANATNDLQGTGPRVQMTSDRFAGFGTFAAAPAVSAVHMQIVPSSNALTPVPLHLGLAHAAPRSGVAHLYLIANEAKAKKAKAKPHKAMLERAPDAALFRNQHRT